VRTALLALLATGAAALPVLAQNTAQGPTGEWRVADGRAHIRVVDCGEALWGVVSWETRAGRDRHNPEPALRQRPTLGLPILLNMRPTDERGRWEGQIYNAKDGRTYDASIALRTPDRLHVEGCALGVLCDGEDWTRVPQPVPQSAGRDRSTTGQASPAHAPSADICSGIAAVPGRPH